jgi:hypothetical protein
LIVPTDKGRRSPTLTAGLDHPLRLMDSSLRDVRG